MYNKNMAKFIEELARLPVNVQEVILENLSQEMVPLEINGNIYMVHEQVSKLIDNLLLQLEESGETDNWPKKEL
tara:strand:- start:30 stop:251 length:222 start_codon:yes stop_codon:yes gene_type:complete